MNNITFQGRTNLIFDRKMYEQFENVTRRNFNHGIMDKDRIIRDYQKHSFETNENNIIVYIFNGKDGIMKKIPILKESAEFISNIEENLNKLLKKSKENLTAWIICGANLEGKKGTKLIELLNKIADVLCDRPDIDTSILVGNKKNINKYAIHQTKEYVNLIVDAEPKLLNDIDNTFDIVELNNVNF